MGILSKLFSSGKKTEVLKPGPEVKDLPPSAARDILIRIYNGPTKEDECIAYGIAMLPASANWSQAEKAFLYYIIGKSMGNRCSQDQRRIPFFAASVLNNPIRTNLAWHEIYLIPELKEYSSVSTENAVKLCRQYPLPDSFDSLLQLPDGAEKKPSVFDTWDEAGKKKFFSHQGQLLNDMRSAGFISPEQHKQLLEDLRVKLAL